MKTQISRRSHDPQKGYSGVYQQQARMITDADWNELQDIARQRLDAAVRDLAGSGLPGSGALSISSDLKIFPGRVYAGGLSGGPHVDAAGVTYDQQPELPGAPGSPQVGESLYADLWEREVIALEDANLADVALDGADTCSRLQTMVQIKRYAGTATAESDPANPSAGDATVRLQLRTPSTTPTLDDPCATEVDIDQHLGNFVFRVEVHEVIGPANAPTGLTLKWSSENASEAYRSDKAPPEVQKSTFAFEFYDVADEKRLGVHLVPGLPARRPLDAKWPAAAPTQAFVRRWDGFCVLAFAGGKWTVTSGLDRGATITVGTDTSSGVLGQAAFLQDGSLKINLSALDFTIALTGKRFVAGDHWLATVRDTDAANSTIAVANNGAPVGVQHRYVTLGAVVAGTGAGAGKPIFQPASGLTLPSLRTLASPNGAGSIGAPPITPAAQPSPAPAPKTLATGTVGGQLGELLGLLNQLISDLRSPNGAGFIGDTDLAVNTRKLTADTVKGQLRSLLGIVDTHLAPASTDHDVRYLRRARVHSSMLNANQADSFTVDTPVAVNVAYREVDAQGNPTAPVVYNGKFTPSLDVRVTTNAGVSTLTVTNGAAVQLAVIVTTFSDSVGLTKDGKESKEATKEQKEVKEKTDKEHQEKTDKEGHEKTDKEHQEKTDKESHEKTDKESQEKTTKESQEKTTKESQEKTAKEHQEKTDKETKEKTDKEHKESKENKDTPDKVDKEDKEKASKEAKEDREKHKDNNKEKDGPHESILRAPFVPDFMDAPALAEGLPMGRAFIRREERPAVGDRALREPPPEES